MFCDDEPKKTGALLFDPNFMYSNCCKTFLVTYNIHVHLVFVYIQCMYRGKSLCYMYGICIDFK